MVSEWRIRASPAELESSTAGCTYDENGKPCLEAKEFILVGRLSALNVVSSLHMAAGQRHHECA